MKIEQIKQARSNRKTRYARPFSNFFESSEQCLAAGNLLLEGSLDAKIVSLIERSVIISTVTAIEVYYRDILDFIFKYCDPVFFKSHLKNLYPDKFDIYDLIDIHVHSVHPLEIVSAAQSFQNVKRINEVFSKLMGGKDLWTSISNLKLRLKDQPETETSFSGDGYKSLDRIFNLRHELVHDPARHSFYSADIHKDLEASISIVFGSDVILSQLIEENKDPELLN
ncbi:hypothetical protein ACFQNF_13055 [Iodobacter arcticus]|uniref:RiboL-PSP-HEPN domain-containing protein n=1 Tax=Iodobacter arcticus TaxID=590593 RepID=A0ABW2QYT0_9NEIS